MSQGHADTPASGASPRRLARRRWAVNEKDAHERKSVVRTRTGRMTVRSDDFGVVELVQDRERHPR